MPNIIHLDSTILSTEKYEFVKNNFTNINVIRTDCESLMTEIKRILRKITKIDEVRNFISMLLNNNYYKDSIPICSTEVCDKLGEVAYNNRIDSFLTFSYLHSIPVFVNDVDVLEKLLCHNILTSGFLFSNSMEAIKYEENITPKLEGLDVVNHYVLSEVFTISTCAYIYDSCPKYKVVNPLLEIAE